MAVSSLAVVPPEPPPWTPSGAEAKRKHAEMLAETNAQAAGKAMPGYPVSPDTSASAAPTERAAEPALGADRSYATAPGQPGGSTAPTATYPPPHPPAPVHAPVAGSDGAYAPALGHDPAQQRVAPQAAPYGSPFEAGPVGYPLAVPSTRPVTQTQTQTSALSNPQYPNTGVVERDESVPATHALRTSHARSVHLQSEVEPFGVEFEVLDCARITVVEQGGAADRAGVEAGSYLLAIDGQLIMVGDDIRRLCWAARARPPPHTLVFTLSREKPHHDREFINLYVTQQARLLAQDKKPDLPLGPVLVPTMVFFEPSHDSSAKANMDVSYRQAEEDAKAGVAMPPLPSDAQFWENLEMQAALSHEAKLAPTAGLSSPASGELLDLNPVWVRAFILAFNRRFPRLLTLISGAKAETFRASDGFCMFAEQRLLTDAAGEVTVRFDNEGWLYPGVEGWNRMVYEWAVTSKTTESYRKFHVQSRLQEKQRTNAALHETLYGVRAMALQATPAAPESAFVAAIHSDLPELPSAGTGFSAHPLPPPPALLTDQTPPPAPFTTAPPGPTLSEVIASPKAADGRRVRLSVKIANNAAAAPSRVSPRRHPAVPTRYLPAPRAEFDVEALLNEI
eukprot:TRINITY_DN16990_c0_g1_i1.p1 TRINITY_DN16990_c0_g1~~TRINITY_DN16990_c0_g1_i1.p1  ORF type:complete len:622 (+),score=132.39 TRINITY_DN16990_c0_g1_i1:121-1986(+)